MVTKEQVLKALEVVKDPELRINIVDLGLVYDVRIDEEQKKVEVDMTLTSPACPVGPMITAQATSVIRQLPDVDDAEINLVWQPPWTPEKMSDRLKKAREMGLMP